MKEINKTYLGDLLWRFYASFSKACVTSEVDCHRLDLLRLERLEYCIMAANLS